MRTKRPFPFAPFAPDQPKSIGSGSGEAKGVIWKDGAYRPFNDFASYGSSATFPGRVVGARGISDAGGAVHFFAGTGSNLYKMKSRAPALVSKSGGYGLANVPAWTFEPYGNRVVAVGAGVKPQVWEFGQSTEFRDLAGDPPMSETAFVVREWLFLASDRTLTWSAFNNIDSDVSWTPSFELQSGFGDLQASGGRIMCGLSGEVGVCFQERAINRIAYVGNPTTWQIDQVEDGRGAIGPHAACRYGASFFFVAEDGFFMFDGARAVSIGDGAVDRYFASRVNYSRRDQVCIAADTERKALIVTFPAGSSSTANEVLIYSLSGQRWTRDEMGMEFIFDAPIEGIVPDDTEAVEAAFGTEIVDEFPADLSFDGPEWSESRRQWMAINTNHTLGTFAGLPRTATVDTAQVEVIPARQAFVSEVWPLTDAPEASVRSAIAAGRSRLATAIDTESIAYGTMNSVGFCPVRASGRYVAARVEIASGATWTELAGVHFDARDAGAR